MRRFAYRAKKNGRSEDDGSRPIAICSRALSNAPGRRHLKAQ